MTKKVISVKPSMSLMEAAYILSKNNFNGLPVVNDNKKILGILTEYDMMVGNSSIYLPTLLKLMNDFDIYGKDKKNIKGDLKKIFAIKVGDAMNKKPLILKDNCSADDIVNAFIGHKDINPILIANKKGRLTGIISRYDIVKLLGSSHIVTEKNCSRRKLDENINKFLNNFERKFVLINKTRTNYWLLLSLFFAMVGFIVAFMIMLQISFS